MLRRTLHAVHVRLAAIALMSLAAAPSTSSAQRVGGTAYGGSVTALGATTRSPVATLPESGGYALGDAETFGVPSTLDARWLTSTATGSTGGGPHEGASAQSVSAVEAVDILSGLIRADVVTAIASSYVKGGVAASNAAGSDFANLVVAGVAVPAGVAPNTRIDLLGIGYVVLNEQIRGGDGVSTSSITVNMIHVYQATGGEIVVGSASSSVQP